MRQGSTVFLKLVIYVIGLAVLAVGISLLVTALGSEDAGVFLPLVLGMYVAAIPFYYALSQALKLLHYIDRREAFSELSVKALKNIKYCAMVIGALYAAGMPYLMYVAELDDAPGLTALGLLIVFASIVIATFAAVLQKLLHDAIEIKTENELTV